LPAVHVDCDFKAPLRYGDVAQIDVTVTQIGTTSCTFAYDVRRANDGATVARVAHTCVVSDLNGIKKIPIPDDVRAVLERHSSVTTTSS
jgi:acyl-CoA thioesterase FadM